MKWLAQTMHAQRGVRPSAAVVRVAMRWQSNSNALQPSNVDDRVATTFPEDSAAQATDYGIASTDAPRRWRRRTDHHSSATDSLLQDIFKLEKQVSVEHQRQRLFIRASELGNTSEPTMVVKRIAVSNQSDGPDPQELEKIAEPQPAASPVPTVTIPTPEEAAAAAASVASHASQRTGLYTPAPLPTAAPAPSSAGAPHTVHTWVPPFVLTPDLLRSSVDGPASEVAFTLEELEDTLFAPSRGEEGEGERETKNSNSDEAAAPTAATTLASTAAAVSASMAAPVAAPPSPPPLAPSKEEAEAAAARDEKTAAVTREERHFSTQEPAAAPAPQTTTSSMQSEPIRETATAAAAPSSSTKSSPKAAPAPPATSTTPAVPVLRCRMRGTAVTVVMTRPSPTPRALLEALHEAVAFVESLPPLPQGSREVRFSVDLSLPRSSTSAFMSPDVWSDMVASPEERMEVQALKERLLRRLLDGPARSLHYVAEVHVGSVELRDVGNLSSSYRDESTTPPLLTVRDVAAELLLACAAHEIRLRERPNVQVDREDKQRNLLRLSFAGIGVGVFPAPATVRHVAQLTRSGNDEEARRAFNGAFDPTAELAPPDFMRRLHTLPSSVSAWLLTRRESSREKSYQSTMANVAEPLDMWRLSVWQPVITQLVRWIPQPLRQAAAAMLTPSTPPSPSFLLPPGTTATDVWFQLCLTVLAASATDAVVSVAVADALRSAPLQRVRRSYTWAFASLCSSALPATPSSRPFVVEVNNACLGATSAADLASEIRDQPGDVVLAWHPDVPLPQRLRFLASLRLADAGAHHRVTALLSGPAGEVDECASLVPSVLQLRPMPHSTAGRSEGLPSDGTWLHELVEVSVPRALQRSHKKDAVGTLSGTANDVFAAVRYVSDSWRRPCTVAADRPISEALCKAARDAEAIVKQASLSPLVRYSELPKRYLKEATSNRSEVSSVSHQFGTPTKAECGLGFLMVLDATCEALCCAAASGQRDITAETLNIICIAALQLDASAGGAFDAADRVAGDSVEALVTAMEAAAAAHHVAFASLPLLRWMTHERLLFYQLNTAALKRFAGIQVTKTEQGETTQ